MRQHRILKLIPWVYPAKNPSSHPSDVDLKFKVRRQVSKLEIDAIEASYRMRGNTDSAQCSVLYSLNLCKQYCIIFACLPRE